MIPPTAFSLKVDAYSSWIEQQWIPERPEHNLIVVKGRMEVVDNAVLRRFDTDFELSENYNFSGYDQVSSPIAPHVNIAYSERISYQAGAFVYRFIGLDDVVEVLILSGFFNDQTDGMVVVTCMPESFLPVWNTFMRECFRISRSLRPSKKVVIVGGRQDSFEPTVDWDDIILPQSLKDDLINDVESFFTRGVEVYTRLKLKPFRKLLLAGVPGTGKTMLCNALAKWCIEREYLVVYISSADQFGSTFNKIEHALSVASTSNLPTLIILEELDAYLNKKEKAVILNVLDGAEAAANEKGTLLISTTNYPESIDERVLKRPGRLDRIFIVPEVKSSETAEQMLRKYLGTMWKDEHQVVAEKLVGFPGAFVREVAIHALTHVAYDDLDELSVELLDKSFQRLKDQIDAKDDFLINRLGSTEKESPQENRKTSSLLNRMQYKQQAPRW